MKLIKSFALLFSTVGLLNTRALMFEYRMLNVFEANAMDHVTELVNVTPYDEGLVKYWKPIASGLEARVTMNFSFPEPTTEVFLEAHLSMYNFGGGNFSSGSLWGSKNGTDWLQILDVPVADGILRNGDISETLPADFLGSKELWIEARMLSSGSTIMAQFVRHDDRDPRPAFQLLADYAAPTSVPDSGGTGTAMLMGFGSLALVQLRRRVRDRLALRR
jgi:hypothetical protein